MRQYPEMRWAFVAAVLVACYRPSDSPDAAPRNDACNSVCVGNLLVTCGVELPCELGCISGDAPHCAVMEAANGVTEADWLVADMGEAQTWSGEIRIDTDTGAIKSDPARIREPGEGVDGGIGWRKVGTTSVFMLRSLVVTGKVTFVGSAPVIFVVAETVLVEGQIDLGGRPTGAPGPGGFAGGDLHGVSGKGCAGGGPGGASQGDDGGGAGGGNGGSGGPGGRTDDATGGQPAVLCGNPEIEPLIGGSGGGAGGFGSRPQVIALGGGGGGALQISARGSIRITTDALITAPGAGGHRAKTQDGFAGAGGGGGAGGSILLEAPIIVQNGGLFANGGGGGGGGVQTMPGSPGDPGAPSLNAAKGGTGAASDNFGGDGAVQGLPAASGGVPANVANAGGGGGGIGRITLRGTVTQAGKASPLPTLLPLRLR